MPAIQRTEPSRPKEPPAQPLASLREGGDCPQRPAVTIITPVKMATTKSADPAGNFRSQISHEYAGYIENIYVFESDRDPGIQVIKKLQQDHEEGRHTIRIVIAGLARTCSQKIHNMLAAVDASDPRSEYVFFLDNSTRCLSKTLSRLVERLETADNCLGVSGYPLDLAPTPTDYPAWIMVRRCCCELLAEPLPACAPCSACVRCRRA